MRIRFHTSTIIITLLIAAIGILLLVSIMPRTTDTLGDSMRTFPAEPHSSGVSEQDALQKISALPEVRAFIAESEDRGNEPSVIAANDSKTGKGGYWDIQVFENFHGADEGHQITFNRYKVYADGSRTVPMFTYGADGAVSLNPEY